MNGVTNGHQILVVEDDPELQTMLSRTLTEAGYEVRQAFDGEAAIALARELPSLIVLDIMLPKIDGRDVLRTLKAEPMTRGIPVVVLSARSSHSDRLLGLELGAEDYMEKPYRMQLLLNRIAHILWKRGQAE